MKRFLIAACGVAVLGAAAGAQTGTSGTSQHRSQAPSTARPAPAVAHKAQTPAAAPSPDIVKPYCVGCHSEKGKAGGLSLVGFDATKADEQAETAERMIRKLRAGMMPPPGARRPEGDVLKNFAASLETRIDAAAALHPNPGHRVFQRLSRAEYARSVSDLLDVDVD